MKKPKFKVIPIDLSAERYRQIQLIAKHSGVTAGQVLTVIVTTQVLEMAGWKISKKAKGMKK